ncbi:MAG: alpha/beta hydrolase [Fibrella sp.]|nr:alpha/beta hydrolase [Armatimonadota bacterium]
MALASDDTSTTSETITFVSQGSRLVGDLHFPQGNGTPLPAVIILGPMTFQRKQAPTEYARRLAASGFAALAFDPRYRGDSEGEPRCLENPLAKVEDVRAAVDALTTRAGVAAEAVYAFAVCQGCSAMLRAATDDSRLKALFTVAGHYRDHDADVQWIGSEEALTTRREKGEAALEKFQSTGEIEYVPAIDPERMDVGMPGQFVWEWYHPWSDRGLWENRYPVMSDAHLLRYESLSAAQRLDKPWLMVHSDNSFLPDAARRQFEAALGEKHLEWEGETAHFQYYDDPVVLDRTAARAADWFRAHKDRS